MTREYDEQTDKLYVKAIRCPYCKNKINAYQMKCDVCGVTKAQIAHASNLQAKEVMKNKTGELVFKTRRRPEDISFTKTVLWLLIGFFGAHNFYTGRRVRGWIMLVCMIIFFVAGFVIPIGALDAGIDMHPWRVAFEDMGMIFPTDALGVASVVMWIWDFCAVVFGYYKYPVRLAEDKKSK